MTKPRIYDEKPLYVRVEPGVRARIEALRGRKRQGEYLRELLTAGLAAEEARRA